MQTYHEWDSEGKHYRAVVDEEYETRGNYAYDTEEATKAAEDEELGKLQSGEWVVLGVIVTEPCPGAEATEDGPDPGLHCPCCTGRKQTDSLWGIVVENSHEAIERFVREEM